jgi:hypothetical protein
MVEVKQLLSNGRDSPLLNEGLPAAAAVSALRCARFRVITAPLRDYIGRSATAPITTDQRLAHARRGGYALPSESAQPPIRQRDR